MALTLTFNGVEYVIPTARETEWAARLNAFLQALSEGAATTTAVASALSAAQTAQSEVDALEVVVGTPTSANTANAIVKRDANGDFVARNIAAANVNSTYLEGATVVVTGNLIAMQGDGTAPGSAATLNTPTGRVTFAAGTKTFTVTNSLVQPESVVLVEHVDAAHGVSVESVSKSAGSFAIALSAAPAAAVTLGFVVMNGA